MGQHYSRISYFKNKQTAPALVLYPYSGCQLISVLPWTAALLKRVVCSYYLYFPNSFSPNLLKSCSPLQTPLKMMSSRLLVLSLMPINDHFSVPALLAPQKVDHCFLLQLFWFSSSLPNQSLSWLSTTCAVNLELKVKLKRKELNSPKGISHNPNILNIIHISMTQNSS